ncbi:MAG: DUF6504 family protein [Mycobacterium leprae]
MARIINRLVAMVTGPGGLPISFRFDGGRQQVKEILDCWVEAGRWWEQESDMKTYRVATGGGGVYELTFLIQPKQWYLYKVYD